MSYGPLSAAQQQAAALPGLNYEYFEPVGDAKAIASTPRHGQAVSAIVTGRNYGRFLDECLHSVYAQTVRPAEVWYADDGSEDDSRQIARRFESHGIRLLEMPHRGVVSARNQAAAAAQGEMLLFVDADNMLAPDYLERQLEAMNGGAAFAYGPRRVFGNSGGDFDSGAWDRDRMWTENLVDTCSLVRRELFEAVDGWQETPARTMWDWDLFLRVSRYGHGAHADSRLYYRHHRNNWSVVHDGRYQFTIETFKGEIRRAAARMAICCVYSGRLPKLVPQWFEALAAALQPGEREKPELFVLDDSPEGFWHAGGRSLETFADCFSSIRVARIHTGATWSERRPDRSVTARFLSSAYNRFLQESPAEVLWFVEDDILVPPGSARRMLKLLLDGHHPRGVVTGLYPNRHAPYYVVGRYDQGRVVEMEQPPPQPEPWELAGTGCLMIFRPAAKATFRPFWPSPYDGTPVPAHDWAYTWELSRAGKHVWAHPEVRCRHYLSETEWRD